MHPSENPQSLMFQGFGGSLKDAVGEGYSLTSDSMPLPFRYDLFLIAIVEGIGIYGGDLGWIGMVFGRCDRGL